MKKQNILPTIIFSVQKDGLNDTDNTENHLKVLAFLKAENIGFKEVTKVYKEKSKLSIVVADTADNRDITLDIIKSFDETDRIFRGLEGHSFLERNKDKVETFDLGYLLQVPSDFAKSKQNWLFDKEANQYYSTVESPESVIFGGLSLKVR